MSALAMAKLMQQVSNIDLGIDCFRDLLPGHGFKLVIPPPPASGALSAFASAWRRGEAQAVSHRGSAAGLALLRAVESELVRLRDASAITACGRCRGVGWFVTDTGTVEICRHAEKANFIAG